MKRFMILLLSAFLALGGIVTQAAPTGAAPADDLYAAINAYRATLGLPAIPLSPELTAVAQAHVQDLIANSTTDPNYTGAGCAPHGWSSKGNWSGGCYKFEDASTYPIMWNKPREITGYPGDGYEILYGANGFTVSAADALQAWQADGPHNDVIVNQGIWQNHPWQAIGVWVQDGWAAVWFGEVADPNAPPLTAPQADTGAAPQPNVGQAPAPAADTGTTTQPANGQDAQPANTTGAEPQTDAQPATANTDGTTGTDNPGAANAPAGDAAQPPAATDNGAPPADAAAGANPAAGADTANPGAGAAAAPACGDAEELAFLAAINAYRATNGLEPLTMSPTLTSAARLHSQDMATNRYFDHTAPDGTTYSQRLTAAGYPGGTTGENIFAGDQTAAGALAWWQNSPPHNRTMLNPAYKAIGIGRAFDPNSDFGWYWTTTFGDVVDATCGTAQAAAQPANTAATTGGQTEQPQTDTTNNGQAGQPGTDTGGTQDPAMLDTDGDGILDDAERTQVGTDPTVFDTDGGGVGDGDEWVNGKNPLDPADDVQDGGTGNGGGDDVDSDGDGLPDSMERDFFGTNPQAADTDGDGVSDGDEAFAGTDPLDPNSV